MQRPDRVASKLRLDRACLAHGVKGGARHAAQRDQESGGVVAMHFDGLAQLFVEAERRRAWLRSRRPAALRAGRTVLSPRPPAGAALVINPAPHGSHSTRQGCHRKGDVRSRDIGRRSTDGAVTPAWLDRALRHIYQKLGVSSRTQLIAIAGSEQSEAPPFASL